MFDVSLMSIEFDSSTSTLDFYILDISTSTCNMYHVTSNWTKLPVPSCSDWAGSVIKIPPVLSAKLTSQYNTLIVGVLLPN